VAQDERRGRDLADPTVLRALLARYGIRHTQKSLGQHLLISREALESIIAAADLAPDESVLEVGAGHGVLTVELARRVRRVVAVEVDREILPVLRETTASYPAVEVLGGDLLDVVPAKVFAGVPYKLVANLPYYITAMALRHFIEATQPPALMVTMVQREVAQRMVAEPGDMSLLSLSVRIYGEPRLVAQVPASAFFPPPQVDSAVVRIQPYAEPKVTPAQKHGVFALAHAAYHEKRKQIHNSLSRQLHVDPEAVRAWLAGAGIDPALRPQMLSLDDWLRLLSAALAHGWIPPAKLPK
jgi:16S rRNA (adenine1518-N6/adenine1519-N6)-dimethyltransferase